MIKKLLSSIIIFMIIVFYSYKLYATNVIVPEDVVPPFSGGQETLTPGDSTDQDSENNTPETGDNNSDSHINDSTNTDNNGDVTDNTGNNDTDNSENKGETNNSQTGSNDETSKDIIQQPTHNNNQETTNNNIVQKSSEARLKKLKVDVEGLTPEFDKNTTEYYLVVDLSVNKLNITASIMDNKAKWAVYGNKNLKEGENTVTIEVTAEDGTKNEYYIYVTKVDDIELANAALESLKIDGFNLYPSFKSNIYNYNLNIDENIKELSISAKPEREKATVEIEGNDNLQEGENIVKITVTAEDETTVRTYKIKTFITSDIVNVEEENKIPAIVLLGILSLGILISGITIIIKNKREK